MVIGGCGHGGAQHGAVLVQGADGGGAEDQELGVVVRGVARIVQAAQLGVADGIVQVLARAVDAGKGLLVQQADHAVAFGHAAHGGHDHLVVVRGQVALLIDGGDFELARGHLVVAGFDRHAQLEQLALNLHHEGKHAAGNHAEVLVLELLALGGLGTEEGAAGDEQVRAGEHEVAVDEEVFLLRTGERSDGQRALDAEQLEHALGLLVQGLVGAQKRGLLVQGLARPGDEGGGDAQEGAVGVLQDVRRAGHVPGGVAAGFKRGAQAAGGEAGGVGLALDQELAAEFGDGAALAVGHEEGVVLLCGHAGERVEHVGEVGGALLDGPVLHGVGHHVGDGGVKLCAQFDGLGQGLVHGLGQAFLHHLVAEDIGPEDVGGLGVMEV